MMLPKNNLSIIFNTIFNRLNELWIVTAARPNVNVCQKMNFKSFLETANNNELNNDQNN